MPRIESDTCDICGKLVTTGYITKGPDCEYIFVCEDCEEDL